MQSLYNEIGATYCATRRADPAIARELGRLLGVSGQGRFLDLACGTGNYTRALASLGGEWCGTDISPVMLAQASGQVPTILWSCSSADALPFRDHAFNGAICSLAIHHFPDLIGAFREVRRVLDDGPIVIFTAFREQMHNYWLFHYFPEMMRVSSGRMRDRAAVVAALEAGGLAVDEVIPFHVTNELCDLFLYSGKNRPDIYFDATVRANISSFASRCTADELRHGLEALRADLDSGDFERVARRYASPEGDYAYVVARNDG